MNFVFGLSTAETLSNLSAPLLVTADPAAALPFNSKISSTHPKLIPIISNPSNIGSFGSRLILGGSTNIVTVWGILWPHNISLIANGISCWQAVLRITAVTIEAAFGIPIVTRRLPTSAKKFEACDGHSSKNPTFWCNEILNGLGSNWSFTPAS